MNRITDLFKLIFARLFACIRVYLRLFSALSGALRRISGVLSVGLLVACLAGCGKGGAAGGGEAGAEAEKSAPVAVEMATAETQTVEITVSAQGTLSPGQGASVRIASPVAGRITTIAVHEGERVQKGQLLARIDNRSQQAAAVSANAALTVSTVQARSAALAAQAAAGDQQSAVKTAQLTLEAARLDRSAQAQQAQNALDAAQTDLTKTRAGARPQEIAQAEQTITQAEATRVRAQTELTRQQFLFDKGIAAKRQLDDATTALALATSAVTSAQQAVSLLKAGARPEDLRAAELRVEGARNALAQSQKSGDAKIQQAQAALRQAEQSRLNVNVKQQDAQAMRDVTLQKRADLAAAQATATYGELRAPIDGTITKRSANPGDLADPATPFLEISNPRGLNLLANLPAEDGLKVRANMNVHVTAADLPDKSYPGRVLSVGQVDPQSNLLAVRIIVANPDNALRVGAFATAQIVLRVLPGAVVVPKSAVVTQEGKSVVFTVGPDNKAQSHAVEVGPEAQGGKLVALLKGIPARTQVVMVGNYELSDGALVKPAEGEKDADAKKDANKDDKKDDTKDDKKDGKNDSKEAKKGADDKKDADKDAKTDEQKAGKP